MPHLNEILEIGTNAARAAAEILKKTWLDSSASVLVRTKHDVKLSADVCSEKTIKSFIKKHRPQDGILAEESGDSSLKNDGVWIIDPLDGTVNFSHNHPHFCVSIAWLWKGKISAGIIYDVVRDELFAAAAGKGATLNNKKISVSNTDNLSRAMIGVGFEQASPSGENKKDFNNLATRVQKLRISGSAALDLAYVACGRLDAYVENSVFIWDLAAGSIIVEEAGGKSCLWKKEKPFMRSCVAANNHLFNEIINSLSLDISKYARTCLDDLNG